MTDHRLVADRIGLVGDTHGDLQWTKRAIAALGQQGVTQIHFLGDFAFVWWGAQQEKNNLSVLTSLLAAAGATGYITEGNHEGYVALDRHFPVQDDGYRHLSERLFWLPRGWRGTTAARTVVASLGGANSVNRNFDWAPKDGRGGNWFWQEQITDADLDALGTDPVDVLLAHDAPRSQRLAQAMRKNVGQWTPEGLDYANMGQQMFHRAVQRVRPALTVSGHYHVSIDTTETFHDLDGAPFESRSVILNCNGFARSVAVLEPDTQQLTFLPDVGTERWRKEAARLLGKPKAQPEPA